MLNFAPKMEQLRVDVDALLRSRAPRYHRWIPGPLIRGLERYICQNRLNELLRIGHGLEGAEFCRMLLHEQQVSVSMSNMPELDPEEPHRVTYVSNHPLGGLDGVALIEAITAHHGVEPLVVVNDLLMVVKPLNSVFLPINKHGAQSRGAATDIEAAFADASRPIAMFPAGMCSRRDPKTGVIADLKWNKMFVTKSIASGRRVIPVHCFARNSDAFYRFALWRKRLGMKFNLEMIALPRELVKAQGNTIRFSCGKPISPEELVGDSAAAMAMKIRNLTYQIP